MIVDCEIRDLQQRCMERGFALEEVEDCIVWRHENYIRVDTDHPAYPSDEKPPEEKTGGPGTELKSLLGRIGIVATENCSCNAKAAVMDFHGPQWCQENVALLSEWLKEEADRRGLPYFDWAGRLLIFEAIRRAKRVAEQKRRSGT